jgi:hypothetical protein
MANVLALHRLTVTAWEGLECGDSNVSCDSGASCISGVSCDSNQSYGLEGLA